jgi:YbbR domain-containing protein
MISSSKKIKQSVSWIISFILAVLVWFIIVNDKEYTVNMEIPIQVYEPREDKTLKNKIPSSAMVRFKGKGRALLSANVFQKPVLILDVANIQERYHVSLNNYYQKYPNRVIYDRGDMEFLEVVYPDTFTILIDDKITRDLPVRPEYQARPAPGYLFPDKPEIDPERVQVTGPKTRLKVLSAIRTQNLDAGEINTDMTLEAELINPDPDFLTFERKSVSISFTVETIGEKRFTNIPVKAENVPENITIRFVPSSVSLKIIGSNERIQSMTGDSIRVYFDYSKEWIPSKIYYQPRVQVPKDVIEWKDLKPSRIEVVIVRR